MSSAPQHRRPGAGLGTVREDQPVTLTLAMTLWLPGLLALIFGEDVSRGLTLLGAGFMARVMGGAMILGSLLASTGVLRHRSLIEALGLVLMASGLLVYGVGVMFGLGLGGAFAGPVTLALAAGLVVRATSLPAIAARISHREP